MIEKILLSVFRRVSAVVENKASIHLQVGGDLSDSQMEITTKDRDVDFKEIIFIEYEGASKVAFRISLSL